MDKSERLVNVAADEALTNAMYRHTFGIVGDGKLGLEGHGVGTGIGVVWKSTFLVLTAAHTMETTPNERLFFLLPQEVVVFQGSSIHSQMTLPAVSKRVQLESQQSFLDDQKDLAAFVLPEQTDEQAKQHFYLLDDSHTTPQTAKQIGFVGYPGETRQPVGSNFMATPYSSFGEMVAVPAGFDPTSYISINYPTSQSVDPHGLSGCGLWIPEKSSEEKLWTPKIRLAGLVRKWDAQAQVLIGYRVEELVSFLKTNDRWMAGP